MNLTSLELILCLTNISWIVLYIMQYRHTSFYHKLAMGWKDNALQWKKELELCEAYAKANFDKELNNV